MNIQRDMDHNHGLFRVLHIAMGTLFLLMVAFILLHNPQNYIIFAIWFCIFGGVTCFRHYYASRTVKRGLRWLLPYVEGAILVFIQSMDQSGTALGLYTLFVMDIAIDYEYTYGFIFAFVGYIAYMYAYIQRVVHIPLSNQLLVFLIAAVQVTLYTGFAFLTKKYSIQSGKLQTASGELKAKMIALEQMTVLKERNRIAGDIHNTVGHQLTTALVQIEATQMLLEIDPDEAKRRLGIIKNQVKEGLHALRESIHAIDAEHEYQNFREAVERLFEQVRTHAQIEINAEMDDIEEVKIQWKKTLYHVIMESITNGIRHGHCKTFRIKLTKDNGRITLSSFNDGIVPKQFDFGYGLTQIKEKAQRLGGHLSIRFNENGWYGLVVVLPVFFQEEDAYEQDQSNAGR